MPDPRIWPIAKSAISGVDVGAVSILVMAANPNRADADFTNDCDCVMYLARGEAAVANQGIRINPNGGTYHIGTNNMWEGEVYAITVESQKCRLAMIEGSRP